MGQGTEGGRPVGQVAAECSIRLAQWRSWKKGSRVESAEDELRPMTREREVMGQERDFVRDATAFFERGAA